MRKETAQHIGWQIRRRRVVLHISQEALGANLGGITQQAVSKMERGGEVSGSQLLEMSRILKVPVSYFFDGLELAVDNPASLKQQPMDSSMSAH